MSCSTGRGSWPRPRAARRTWRACSTLSARRRAHRIALMRLRASAKEQLIKSVPLFSHCSRAEIMALAGEADELTLPTGKELTRQGERGREFMVIVDGAARVEKDGRLLNELGPSDFLGEIALL